MSRIFVYFEPIQLVMKEIDQKILELVQEQAPVSRAEIGVHLGLDISPATSKRLLLALQEQGWIRTEGKGKATVYVPTPFLQLTFPIELEKYFQKEQDERKIQTQFDFAVFEKLASVVIFTSDELSKLDQIHQKFQSRVKYLSGAEYRKEMERLAIDLSWKSSQIEGNTYSLLETEILLREKKTASGKTRDEATMLLNHKEAIDFLVDNPDYASSLTVRTVGELHSLLIKELGINRNIRKRRVGITGTNYNPLDNEFQIRDALDLTCQLVNATEDPYQKALLSLVLISYIQPFLDGNKRTARILSNGILMAYAHCPLSFRTVDALDYKKAMLVFYERNNLSPMKEIFIEQAEFAVDTYF